MRRMRTLIKVRCKELVNRLNEPAGICYDEVAHVEGALSMYEKGLELIDRAGQLPNATQHPLYAKMLKAREHILQRLPDLRKQQMAEKSEKVRTLLDAMQKANIGTENVPRSVQARGGRR